MRSALPILLVLAALLLGPGPCGPHEDPTPTPTELPTATPTEETTSTPPPSATPSPPPATPPAGRCRNDSDCDDMGGMCIRDDEPLPCGPAPEPSECELDGECPGGVCQLDLWVGCGAPERWFCTSPCTAGSCGATDLICDLGTGHCRGRTCDEGLSCPAPSTCPAGANGCQRPTCDDDSDCSAGNRCVEGGCYLDWGTCMLPPP